MSTRRGRWILVIVATAAAVALWAPPVYAQTTANLTISADVGSWLELTLSPNSISFANANPATTPTINANTTVSVTARVRTGSTDTPHLTVLANGDLAAGGASIPITQVSWTATSPYIAGTMNKTTPQSAATFTAGSGERTGTFTFTLTNSWSYTTGSYSQTATYTLTAT